MEYRVSLKDKFSVCILAPLSDFEQKLFVNLYQPLLTNAASSLYLALIGTVPFGMNESNETEHKTILKTLRMNSVEAFLTARHELEALGLIDTYVYNCSVDDSNMFVYIVKKLPTPWEYFNDEILSTLLLNTLGENGYYELAGYYLAHRFDLKKFEKITKSIDDVYNIEKTNNNLSSWWVDSSNQELTLNKTHFDYEYYLVLVGARSVLDKEILESAELYRAINRLAWMFGLNAENLATATITAITNGTLDYNVLRTNAKKIYSDNFSNEQLDLKVKTNKETSNNVLVSTLNSITPSQLVENKYNTKLTGSEIELFDKLLAETNISVGVLNVLIIYVMDTKDGEIPSYNYFLKIINTWIRKGVKNTTDALNLISTPAAKNKTKKVPAWYQDYLQELENKKQPTSDSKQETLDDLEEFFNTKKE